MLGLGGEKPREKVAKLIEAVEGLKRQCGVPVRGAQTCLCNLLSFFCGSVECQ